MGTYNNFHNPTKLDIIYIDQRSSSSSDGDHSTLPRAQENLKKHIEKLHQHTEKIIFRTESVVSRSFTGAEQPYETPLLPKKHPWLPNRYQDMLIQRYLKCHKKNNCDDSNPGKPCYETHLVTQEMPSHDFSSDRMLCIDAQFDSLNDIGLHAPAGLQQIKNRNCMCSPNIFGGSYKCCGKDIERTDCPSYQNFHDVHTQTSTRLQHFCKSGNAQLDSLDEGLKVPKQQIANKKCECCSKRKGKKYCENNAERTNKLDCPWYQTFHNSNTFPRPLQDAQTQTNTRHSHEAQKSLSKHFHTEPFERSLSSSDNITDLKPKEEELLKSNLLGGNIFMKCPFWQVTGADGLPLPIGMLKPKNTDVEMWVRVGPTESDQSTSSQDTEDIVKKCQFWQVMGPEGLPLPIGMFKPTKTDVEMWVRVEPTESDQSILSQDIDDIDLTPTREHREDIPKTNDSTDKKPEELPFNTPSKNQNQQEMTPAKTQSLQDTHVPIKRLVSSEGIRPLTKFILEPNDTRVFEVKKFPSTLISPSLSISSKIYKPYKLPHYSCSHDPSSQVQLLSDDSSQLKDSLDLLYLEEKTLASEDPRDKEKFLVDEQPLQLIGTPSKTATLLDKQPSRLSVIPRKSIIPLHEQPSQVKIAQNKTVASFEEQPFRVAIDPSKTDTSIDKPLSLSPATASMISKSQLGTLSHMSYQTEDNISHDHNETMLQKESKFITLFGTPLLLQAIQPMERAGVQEVQWPEQYHVSTLPSQPPRHESYHELNLSEFDPYSKQPQPSLASTATAKLKINEKKSGYKTLWGGDQPTSSGLQSHRPLSTFPPPSTMSPFWNSMCKCLEQNASAGYRKEGLEAYRPLIYAPNPQAINIISSPPTCPLPPKSCPVYSRCWELDVLNSSLQRIVESKTTMENIENIPINDCLCLTANYSSQEKSKPSQIIKNEVNQYKTISKVIKSLSAPEIDIQPYKPTHNVFPSLDKEPFSFSNQQVDNLYVEIPARNVSTGTRTFKGKSSDAIDNICTCHAPETASILEKSIQEIMVMTERTHETHEACTCYKPKFPTSITKTPMKNVIIQLVSSQSHNKSDPTCPCHKPELSCSIKEIQGQNASVSPLTQSAKQTDLRCPCHKTELPRSIKEIQGQNACVSPLTQSAKQTDLRCPCHKTELPRSIKEIQGQNASVSPLTQSAKQTDLRCPCHKPELPRAIKEIQGQNACVSPLTQSAKQTDLRCPCHKTELPRSIKEIQGQNACVSPLTQSAKQTDLRCPCHKPELPRSIKEIQGQNASVSPLTQSAKQTDLRCPCHKTELPRSIKEIQGQNASVSPLTQSAKQTDLRCPCHKTELPQLIKEIQGQNASVSPLTQSAKQTDLRCPCHKPELPRLIKEIQGQNASVSPLTQSAKQTDLRCPCHKTELPRSIKEIQGQNASVSPLTQSAKQTNLRCPCHKPEPSTKTLELYVNERTTAKQSSCKPHPCQTTHLIEASPRQGDSIRTETSPSTCRTNHLSLCHKPKSPHSEIEGKTMQNFSIETQSTQFPPKPDGRCFCHKPGDKQIESCDAITPKMQSTHMANTMLNWGKSVLPPSEVDPLGERIPKSQLLCSDRLTSNFAYQMTEVNNSTTAIPSNQEDNIHVTCASTQTSLILPIPLEDNNCFTRPFTSFLTPCHRNVAIPMKANNELPFYLQTRQSLSGSCQVQTPNLQTDNPQTTSNNSKCVCKSRPTNLQQPLNISPILQTQDKSKVEKTPNLLIDNPQTTGNNSKCVSTSRPTNLKPQTIFPIIKSYSKENYHSQTGSEMIPNVLNLESRNEQGKLPTLNDENLHYTHINVDEEEEEIFCEALSSQSQLVGLRKTGSGSDTSPPDLCFDETITHNMSTTEEKEAKYVDPCFQQKLTSMKNTILIPTTALEEDIWHGMSNTPNIYYFNVSKTMWDKRYDHILGNCSRAKPPAFQRTHPSLEETTHGKDLHKDCVSSVSTIDMQAQSCNMSAKRSYQPSINYANVPNVCGTQSHTDTYKTPFSSYDTRSKEQDVKTKPVTGTEIPWEAVKSSHSLYYAMFPSEAASSTISVTSSTRFASASNLQTSSSLTQPADEVKKVTTLTASDHGHLSRQKDKSQQTKQATCLPSAEASMLNLPPPNNDDLTSDKPK